MMHARLILVLAFLLAPRLLANLPYPAHFEFSNGQAFAFIGDEVTYDGRYCQYVENFFYTRYPDKRLIFYNAGTLNDTAGDVLLRLGPDVIERKIDYAIVMLGAADGAGEDFSAIKFAEYQRNVRQILRELENAKAHPFLASPPMFDWPTHHRRLRDDSYRFRDKPFSENYNGVLGYYSSWLRDEATAHGVRFMDPWSVLNTATAQQRRTNPEFSLTPDACLPDAAGHAVMAADIIESLQPDRRDLGTIKLWYVSPEKGWESRSKGGTASGIGGTKTSLSFLWKARALPWVMPMEAAIGAQISGIDERFNREMLHVIGLDDGNYELLIAGEKVGADVYKADELAAGVALHAIWNRPDFTRAQALAVTNQKRYEFSVRPMRDLWQTVKRTQVNFPGNAAKLKAVMDELSPRMATLRAAAKEQADQIYAGAAPVARNFEIRRVLTEDEKKAAAAAAAATPPAPKP